MAEAFFENARECFSEMVILAFLRDNFYRKMLKMKILKMIFREYLPESISYGNASIFGHPADECQQGVCSFMGEGERAEIPSLRTAGRGEINNPPPPLAEIRIARRASAVGAKDRL